MRIAVLFDLASPQMGGSYSFNEMIFNSLSRNQSKYSHQVLTVYEEKNNLGLRPDIALPGKIRYRIEFLKTLLSQIGFGSFLKNGVNLENCRSASIRSTLKKNNIDVVWAVQPLGHRLDIPYLTTSWDISHRITPYFPEISFKESQIDQREKICTSVFSGAFRIIVGTDRGKQEIITAYGVNPERLIINPLPVDIRHPNPSISRSLTQIIYPANFWPHKNHLLLIKALSILNLRSDSKISLVLTGSDKGSFNAVKSLVVDLELQDSVHFLGFVPKTDLENLYLSSNLLVYPSLIGPDNLPPLEALSFGCKTVVADIPGAREQFGEFATYFNPHCVEDLVDKIEQSLQINSNSLNSTKLNSFLEGRSADRYIEIVLEEIEKLNHIIDVI